MAKSAVVIAAMPLAKSRQSPAPSSAVSLASAMCWGGVPSSGDRRARSSGHQQPGFLDVARDGAGHSLGVGRQLDRLIAMRGLEALDRAHVVGGLLIGKLEPVG